MCSNVDEFIDGLVSVIVPVYNVEKYLSKCLDSIINQSYTKLEIICVDDSSTDGSCSIISDYLDKDSRISLLIHTDNKGLSAARNTGLYNSHGEYIAFIDSDDYVSSNYIMDLVTCLKKNNSDICIGKTEAFFGEDEYCNKKKNNAKSTNSCIDSNLKSYKDLYCFDLPVTAWGKIYKHEFIYINKLRFINGLIHEDEAWSLLVYNLTTNISFSDSSVYFYRKRSGSITSVRDNVNYGYSLNYLKLLKTLYRLNYLLFIKNITNNVFFDKYNRKLLLMVYWMLKKIKKSSSLKDKNLICLKYISFLQSKYNFKPTLSNILLNFFTNTTLLKLKFKIYLCVSKILNQ